MKKIGDYFEKEYKKCFNYLKKSTQHIYFIIGFFFLFSLFGFFIPLPEEIQLQLMDYFRELILKTQSYSALEMVGFLFYNNSIATFFGMVLGSFFGVFSIFNGMMNGFILGFAVNLSVFENGLLSIWRLFPHGIFELPAVFISLGLGVKLGTSFFGRNKWETFRKYLRESFRVYIWVILPLLVIAAIIEGLLISFGV